MQRSKDFTFIGFAIKARKIVLGYNTLIGDKKKKYLVIMCESASQNTAKDIVSYANKHKLTLIKTHNILLEEIVNKSNCKVAAITDKNIATAIKSNLSGNFEIIDGGIFNEYNK